MCSSIRAGHKPRDFDTVMLEHTERVDTHDNGYIEEHNVHG
ncbi:MAG: hypothetical protein AAFY98_10425 [Verrucomicrobiota bacterium]